MRKCAFLGLSPIDASPRSSLCRANLRNFARGRLEQARDVNTQRIGQGMNHVQGRIANAGFDPAHVRAEDANSVGELLLREAFLASELFDAGAEGLTG